MIEFMGWLGSGLVVASLLQSDVRRLRQINLAASIALGIFNVALGIGSMIALNVVLASVNGYYLLKKHTDAQHDDPSAPADRAVTFARSAPSSICLDEASVAVEQHRAAAGRLASPVLL